MKIFSNNKHPGRLLARLVMLVMLPCVLALVPVHGVYAEEHGGGGGPPPGSGGGHDGGSHDDGGHDDGHDDGGHDDGHEGGPGSKGKRRVRAGHDNPQGGGSHHLEDRVFHGGKPTDAGGHEGEEGEESTHDDSSHEDSSHNDSTTHDH